MLIDHVLFICDFSMYFYNCPDGHVHKLASEAEYLPLNALKSEFFEEEIQFVIPVEDAQFVQLLRNDDTKACPIEHWTRRRYPRMAESEVRRLIYERGLEMVLREYIKRYPTAAIQIVFQDFSRAQPVNVSSLVPKPMVLEPRESVIVPTIANLAATNPVTSPRPPPGFSSEDAIQRLTQSPSVELTIIPRAQSTPVTPKLGPKPSATKTTVTKTPAKTTKSRNAANLGGRVSPASTASTSGSTKSTRVTRSTVAASVGKGRGKKMPTADVKIPRVDDVLTAEQKSTLLASIKASTTVPADAPLAILRESKRTLSSSSSDNQDWVPVPKRASPPKDVENVGETKPAVVVEGKPLSIEQRASTSTSPPPRTFLSSPEPQLRSESDHAMIIGTDEDGHEPGSEPTTDESRPVFATDFIYDGRGENKHYRRDDGTDKYRAFKNMIGIRTLHAILSGEPPLPGCRREAYEFAIIPAQVTAFNRCLRAAARERALPRCQPWFNRQILYHWSARDADEYVAENLLLFYAHVNSMCVQVIYDGRMPYSFATLGYFESHLLSRCRGLNSRTKKEDDFDYLLQVPWRMGQFRRCIRKGTIFIRFMDGHRNPELNVAAFCDETSTRPTIVLGRDFATQYVIGVDNDERTLYLRIPQYPGGLAVKCDIYVAPYALYETVNEIRRTPDEPLHKPYLEHLPPSGDEEPSSDRT